ncbi:MAG: hypothetical protein ACOYJH_00350 [Anaerovoracaceae bacterium]
MAINIIMLALTMYVPLSLLTPEKWGPVIDTYYGPVFDYMGVLGFVIIMPFLAACVLICQMLLFETRAAKMIASVIYLYIILAVLQEIIIGQLDHMTALLIYFAVLNIAVIILSVRIRRLPKQ